MALFGYLQGMNTVEYFAKVRATRSRAGFIDAVGGAAVLVRLDERGGRDEPAPWAFWGKPAMARVRGDPRYDPAWRVSDGPGAAQPGSAPSPAAAPDASAADGDATFSSSAVHGGDLHDFDDGDDSFEEATVTLSAAPMAVPSARGAASVIPIPTPLGAPRSLVLGRDVRAQVRIDERCVSRVHAELRAGASAFAIRDRGSSEGTRINGVVLPAGQLRELRSGDLLTLGDVHCLFLTTDAFWERVDSFAD